MFRWLIAIVMSMSALSAGVIEPGFMAKLNSMDDHDMVRAIVTMRESPDFATLKSLGKRNVAAYLRDLASRSQKDVLAYLDTQKDAIDYIYPFWVINGFAIRAEKQVILQLAARDDIGIIEEDRKVEVYRDRAHDGGNSSPKTVQWNIRKIKADSVWALGYDGSGVLVGIMDTGIDPDHPALEGRFSGLWKDCINNNPMPYDPDSHGTHVAGTITGDGPYGIGVAPGAQFAMARVVGSGGGYGYQILQGFQWYVSLVSDSGYNIPLVSNSWGNSNTTTTYFWNAVLSWRAVGIIPVFAIGNDGPSSGTAGTPGNFPTVIGVGATTYQDRVASFSSRGPAPHQSPWSDTTYWPIPDWNYIKPDISAPGQGIMSSVPGGRYATWDGTSMATPHIAGVIALMFSKNPDLDFDQVYNILTTTADRPASGGSYPNNSYGWGRVNALAAVNAVPAPTDPNLVLIDYTVTSPSGGHIVPGDTANIVVQVTNISSVVANGVTATLTTDDPHVTVINGSCSLGDIARGDTVNNSSSPFTFAVSPTTPDGYDVTFQLRLQASSGYTRDFALTATIGVPRMDVADIHTVNATFSLVSNGALGFADDNQSAGSGFVYRGTQTLFYGSLAAGNASDYVVDNWYEHSTDDGDWMPTSDPPGRLYYMDPGAAPWYGDEQVWGMVIDSGHATPKGLAAEFIGFAQNEDAYGDFVITAYKFRNLGTETLNDLYFAWFIDFDINDAASNYSRTDTLRRVAYMWGGATYAGISVPDTSLPIANLSVINNQTYVYPDTGMVDTNQWHFMNGSYHFSQGNSAGDWSVVVSVGPITLNPGDSVCVPFAIVGGYGMNNFLAHVDSARVLYYNPLLNIEEEPVYGTKPYGIMLSANPLLPNGVISFSVPSARHAEVRLYDAAGRLVAVPFNGMAEAGINSVRLPSSLSNGVYFVQLKAADISDTKRIVVVR